MECSEKLSFSRYTREELEKIHICMPDEAVRKQVKKNWDSIAKPLGDTPSGALCIVVDWRKRFGMRSAFALRINSGKNIFMFATLENLRIFQSCFFKRGGVAGNFPAMPKATPSGSLRSPAPPRGRLCAMLETLPLPPKAVPLGKVA